MTNQQLLDFISQQLSKGLTKDVISKELLSNGWTNQDIEEGFNLLKPPVPKIPTPSAPSLINTFTPPSYNNANSFSAPVQVKAKTHSGRNIFLVILVLFLLAGGASAYYFKDNLLKLPIVKSIFPGKVSTLTETPTVGLNQEQNLPTGGAGVITQPTISNGIADCVSDINCFINEAKSCTPSTASLTINQNDGKGTILVDKENSKIMGYVGTNCHFFYTTLNYVESQDQNYLKELVASGKYTQAQIDEGQKRIAQMTIDLNKQTIGTTRDCSLATQDLINLLSYWQSPSGNGYSMIADQLLQDSCKVTLNTGKVINPTKTTNSSSSSQPPVISGINGPQSLKINQEGTWKIISSNSTKGDLSYFIGWGEGGGEGSSFTGQDFSHKYLSAGTYSIAFSLKNSSGVSAEKNFKVTVLNEDAKVPTVTMSANPTNVAVDGSSVLTWNSTNATSCVLNDGNSPSSKNEPISGSLKVGPLTKNQNLYGLWCENSDGKSNALVTITVSDAPVLPKISFIADKDRVSNGGYTTLRWSAPNATSCGSISGISGSPQNQANSGSVSTGPLTTYKNYNISCGNSIGWTTASVGVDVLETTTTVSLLSPNSGANWTVGQNNTIFWTSTSYPTKGVVAIILMFGSSGNNEFGAIKNIPFSTAQPVTNQSYVWDGKTLVDMNGSVVPISSIKTGTYHVRVAIEDYSGNPAPYTDSPAFTLTSGQ